VDIKEFYYIATGKRNWTVTVKWEHREVSGEMRIRETGYDFSSYNIALKTYTMCLNWYPWVRLTENIGSDIHRTIAYSHGDCLSEVESYE